MKTDDIHPTDVIINGVRDEKDRPVHGMARAFTEHLWVYKKLRDILNFSECEVLNYGVLVIVMKGVFEGVEVDAEREDKDHQGRYEFYEEAYI
ncbi:MAG: hypothetical protein ACE5GF_08555 [Thermodesulfobacteriota bacterium]